MAKKILFEFTDPLPDPEPPPEGWHEVTCTWESHTWHLELEDGNFSIRCADPCDLSLFDPSGKYPVCAFSQDWEREDFHTPEPIPVNLKFVDDSSPSGPWGPAEYGYYIEVYERAAPNAATPRTDEDAERLAHRIAAELDKPSVYMGGPSPGSLRKARAIVRLLDHD